MDLILWRHCEAAPGYPDNDRALTAAGAQHAVRMAAWLNGVLPAERTIVASPAVRAQQTARALSTAFDTNLAVGTAALPEGILEAVGWPYGERTIVVVGHQPTLGATAALALTGRPGLFVIPAGAVWWLSRREHSRETLLRAVMTAELLPPLA
ncbi:MAG TPA: histidine phosphatase family protein [Burkholderiales bacterium]|nr:histidine phosphatase family protein [Burkholderiales bacterium]